VQRYPTGLSGSEDTCQQENYYYDSNPFFVQLLAVFLRPPRPPSNTLRRHHKVGFPAEPRLWRQYSYAQAGAKVKKGLLVTRTLQWQNINQNNPPTISAKQPRTWSRVMLNDNEGRMLSVQYPGSTGAQVPIWVTRTIPWEG